LSARTEAVAAPEATAADPRLRALAERSRLFFERLLDNLPAESRAAIARLAAPIPSAPTSAPPADAPPQPLATPESTYAKTVQALAAAATHLPALARSFSTDWPAKSRPVLPGKAASSRREHTWAPVLAWIVLRSLPCDPLGGRAELFDRLLLRSAFADIFSSMGMEGEAKWQAAAQVRLLLTPASVQPDAIRTAALFRDPDARWLAGVNHASGTTYFNKEQFEELLTWLQLPTLIQIVQKGAGQAASLAKVEAGVASALAAASTAGYNLEAYLASSEPPAPAQQPRAQTELAAKP
jgi:hypothetical protein